MLVLFAFVNQLMLKYSDNQYSFLNLYFVYLKLILNNPLVIANRWLWIIEKSIKYLQF